MKTTAVLAVLACAWCLACMVLTGCAVGWQINMPYSYSQAHSRGTSYNAADAKAMDISGTSEAFQQQRATTTTGDALATSSDQAKATDLAKATGQSTQTTETTKAQEQGQATTSGAQTATATPTKTTSIAPTLAVAPGGVAGNKVAAPNASPGDATADASGATPAPAAKAVANYEHVAISVDVTGDRQATAKWDGGEVAGTYVGGFTPTDGADGLVYVFSPATVQPVRLLCSDALAAKLK